MQGKERAGPPSPAATFAACAAAAAFYEGRTNRASGSRCIVFPETNFLYHCAAAEVESMEG
jgi:hypothetical protein